MTDNPNAQNKDGDTPIYYAAYTGHTEIIKIFAPMTINPNTPDRNRQTPILEAAQNGHTKIVKIIIIIITNVTHAEKDFQ